MWYNWVNMEEVFVEKFIPGGQALGTLADGRKIFFWNALPGETVTEFEITKKKSHYVEAVATAIKNPSPHRVEPKDECYLSTSPWQNMDFDYEMEQKAKIVKELFRENQIEIDVPEIKSDEKVFQYRNKMEYALYYDLAEEKIKLAFHARGSHRKIPVSQSSIERPEIFNEAVKVVEDLNERHEEARKYQSLLLRCDQNGNVSGGLFENGKPHPVFENLKDKILGHEYSYSPNGFFQINLPVYELALSEMAKYIETESVLDLYSGVGTIGLSIARDKKLVLVECNGFAYSELENNVISERSSLLSSQGSSLRPRSNCGCSLTTLFPNSEFPQAVHSNSEEALEYIEPEQTVILDPPRAGCDKKLIDKLLEVRPKKIIYLSCNPATQARDVKMLLEKYQIEDVKTFNFFPRTPHIENLVILK